MRLNQTIATRFAADELAALAAELDAADDQPAAPPDERVTALLVALAGRGRAADLLAALAARAPDVDWAAYPWPPAALAALHDALDRRLDADGLRDLCLRLDIDPDNLPGQTKRARARELVRLLARQGRLLETEFLPRNSVSNPPGRPPETEFLPRNSVSNPVSRVIIITLLALCLLAGLALRRAGPGWAAGPALPEGVVGLAVAEFAESTDCRRGPRGAEASALVYETLERELAAAGLGRRVALTRAGRVCDAAAALAAGRVAGAEIIVWGWLPQTTDGLVAAFTPIDPAAPASADLARAFEALFTGPDDALSLRLSGRAVVLSRFLLGLLSAGQGDQATAETLYSAAVAAVEAELAAAGPAGGTELRRTLAVLLTERGKARAALGRAAEASADFDAAERLNPDYLRLLVARAADAYNRRDWAAAEVYLDRAALQDEPLPAIAYGYGLLAYYRGQHAAAVAQFDRAIALSDAAVYHLARGYSYAALGQCATAAADFHAAANDPAAPAAVREAAGAAGCGEGRVAGGEEGTTDDDRPPTADSATAMPVTHLSPEEMAAAGVGGGKPLPTRAAATLTPTPTSVVATPGPLLLEIGPRGANVRSGPGPQYTVMATRRAGARLEVVAASASGEWYQVRVPGQGRGWVSAAYAAALGEVGELGIGNYQSGVEETVTPAGWLGATAVAGARGSGGAGERGRGTATPVYTPPGQMTPFGSPTPTAPAPPYGPPPTHTPPAPPPPTATLLPPPTARASGQ